MWVRTVAVVERRAAEPVQAEEGREEHWKQEEQAVPLEAELLEAQPHVQALAAVVRELTEVRPMALVAYPGVGAMEGMEITAVREFRALLRVAGVALAAGIRTGA
jgi:hypothetical protein